MTAALPGAWPPATLFDCLRAQAQHTPHAFALLAPGRRPLTYSRLLAQVQHTVAQLLVFGVGRGDRVALVAESGPELALAVLGTLSGAACAPLNPKLTAAEYAYLFDRLGVRAVIVHNHAVAAAAARERGLPVLALTPLAHEPAGVFTLQGELKPLSGPGGAAQADDVALLLHTSGTTAAPKLVPVTHRRLLLSGQYLQSVFGLTAADRAFTMIPLHLIHGLLSGLLVSLLAGGSVVCAPGFSAAHVLSWLREFQPTWYSATPALHQALLGLLTEAPAMRPASLRFLRSGGAPLRESLQRALEERFGVPVIDGYGMTEANPIASNPLPPGVRKPGSVGRSAGPEIGIMAPGSAALLPAGAEGEVVVRGPNVIGGYAGDALANVQAFTGDWFRTGDLGYLDADGYLFLTGRLKEVINHGGEKVSPGEVEAVLRAHPAVAEVIAFGVPDERLGEVVAVAVVARAGASPTETELRHFAAERLADYKVPRRIVLVPALPVGANGKVQRLGLAQQLGLTGPAPHAALPGSEPPQGALETRLAAIWQAVLDRAQVGRHDRFLDLGGDSLLASQLIARVAEAFALDLNVVDLFEAPTIAEQAALVAAWLNEARPNPGVEITGSI